MDRELLAEHLDGPTSNPDFDHSDNGLFRIQGHDMRARAAMGLSFAHVPKGFRSRNVLPFNKETLQIEPYSFVHHLPDNYTNNPNELAGKVPVNNLFIPASVNTYLKKKAKLATRYFIDTFLR
jgi:hypothetical protein